MLTPLFLATIALTSIDQWSSIALHAKRDALIDLMHAQIEFLHFASNAILNSISEKIVPILDRFFYILDWEHAKSLPEHVEAVKPKAETADQLCQATDAASDDSYGVNRCAADGGDGCSPHQE